MCGSRHSSIINHQSSIVVAAALLLFGAAHPIRADLTVTGFLTARGAYATGQPSWIEGGFGRLDVGARGTSGHRNEALGLAQIGIDWAATKNLSLHVHGLGRYEPSRYSGRRGGVVEAYVDLETLWRDDALRLRAGQFFVPTSRENKGDLWTSPYSITLSALNSWIAQEFRPIGVDGQWQRTTTAGEVLTFGATAFRGNDSMGATLAWHGWKLGNRLSVLNEVLVLPPLRSLSDPRMFAEQRDDGTKPFGRDLDGRTGFAARLRLALPERGMIQYARVDNNGDRLIRRGEYSWRTKFHLASAELGNTERTVLAAEYMNGTTGMGLPPNAFVQMTFDAVYILASRKAGRNRFSARYDRFSAEDLDGSIAENNTESGYGWMLAWLFDLTDRTRLVLELTQASGRRPAAEESGFDGDADGRSVMIEIRRRF